MTAQWRTLGDSIEKLQFSKDAAPITPDANNDISVFGALLAPRGFFATQDGEVTITTFLDQDRIVPVIAHKDYMIAFKRLKASSAGTVWALL